MRRMILGEGARIRLAVLLLALAWAGCASEGQGTAPPLPGEPPIDGDSSAAGGDAGSMGSGDDGGASSEGAAPADPGGGTCNDLLHALRAFFVLPPVPCKSSSDCPAGDCCNVGPSSSTCVMQ
jgi:hypothetical protein